MARGSRGARSYRRTAPTPPSDQEVGDALRTVFGSREEVAEFFGALEAKLVAEMQRICAEGKRARDAEFPIPPEDDRPAAHGSVPRLVTIGQLHSDETAARGSSSPQGAEVMKAATPEALTEEARLDKASR